MIYWQTINVCIYVLLDFWGYPPLSLGLLKRFVTDLSQSSISGSINREKQSSLKKSTAQISGTDKFGPNLAEQFEF